MWLGTSSTAFSLCGFTEFQMISPYSPVVQTVEWALRARSGLTPIGRVADVVSFSERPLVQGSSWSRPSLATPMADGINAALLWPSSQRTVLVFFPFSPTFSSQTISAIPRTLITIYLYANHYQTYISNPLLFLEVQIGTPYCLIYIYFECLTDNSNLTCQKSNS